MVSPVEEQLISLAVESVATVARDVLSVTLVPTTGQHLPDWDPGAHIDLVLPSGRIRPYSLCGDVRDTRRYRIAILHQPAGRGGSVEAHALLRPQVCVQARGPKNHFALVAARRFVFVAGGIGITPIFSQIQAVHAEGLDWHLFYGARSRANMAFVDSVTSLDPARVTLVFQDQHGLLDLERIVAFAADAELYCCGPESLITALEQQCNAAGKTLHSERFRAGLHPSNSLTDEAVFKVTLARSGKTLTVAPSQSLLDALLDAGVVVAWSCREGMCGTCAITVVEGQIDHRDDVLTAGERDTNRRMMVCVSRGRGSLVLDV
jgi:ferredoxin-NADP reductase